MKIRIIIFSIFFCLTIAILNKNGGFVENTTIYPHAPQNKIRETEEKLKYLVKKHAIEAIAIGNGTAGLETEKLCDILDAEDDDLFENNFS